MKPAANERPGNEPVAIANREMSYSPNLQVPSADLPFYEPGRSIRYAAGRSVFHVDDNHLSAAGAEEVRTVPLGSRLQRSTRAALCARQRRPGKSGPLALGRVLVRGRLGGPLDDRAVLPSDGAGVHDDLGHVVALRKVVHDLQHDALEDGPERPGPGL